MTHKTPTILACVLLAACAAEPVRPPPAAAPEPPRNVLASIRDAAVAYRGDFHVELLREPAVAEAIKRAHRHEMRGRRDRAEAELRKVLDDPEARQRYAELVLARGDAARAEQLAREAWDRGPKVGEWCARSWFTIAEARLAQHAPNGAEQARERARDCQPPKVDRY